MKKNIVKFFVFFFSLFVMLNVSACGNPAGGGTSSTPPIDSSSSSDTSGSINNGSSSVGGNNSTSSSDSSGNTKIAVPEYLGISASSSQPSSSKPKYAKSDDDLLHLINDYYSNGNSLGEAQPLSFECDMFSKPNEKIYIEIWLDNPDQCTILSLRLNNIKYQVGGQLNSYFYENGTNCVFVEVQIPESTYVSKEYTVTELQYVEESNAISGNGKDVLLSGKDTTVKIGLPYQHEIVAEINNESEEISYHKYEIEAEIIDESNIISNAKAWVRALLLDENDNVVAQQKLNKGNNTITFSNLIESSDYELTIISRYDKNDDKDVTTNILSRQTFTTTEYVSLDATADYHTFEDKTVGAKITVGASISYNKQVSKIEVYTIDEELLYTASDEEIETLNNTNSTDLISKSILNGNELIVRVYYDSVYEEVTVITPNLTIPSFMGDSSISVIDDSYITSGSYVNEIWTVNLDDGTVWEKDGNKTYYSEEYKTSGYYYNGLFNTETLEYDKIRSGFRTSQAEISEEILIYTASSGTVSNFRIEVFGWDYEKDTRQYLYQDNIDSWVLYAGSDNIEVTKFVSMDYETGDNVVTNVSRDVERYYVITQDIFDNQETYSQWYDELLYRLVYEVDLNDGNGRVTVCREVFPDLDKGQDTFYFDTLTTDPRVTYLENIPYYYEYDVESNEIVLTYNLINYPTSPIYLVASGGYTLNDNYEVENLCDGTHTTHMLGDGVWWIQYWPTEKGSVSGDKTNPAFSNFVFPQHSYTVFNGIGYNAINKEIARSKDPIFTSLSEEKVLELYNRQREIEHYWVSQYIKQIDSENNVKISVVEAPNFFEEESIRIDLSKYPTGTYDIGHIYSATSGIAYESEDEYYSNVDDLETFPNFLYFSPLVKTNRESGTFVTKDYRDLTNSKNNPLVCTIGQAYWFDIGTYVTIEGTVTDVDGHSATITDGKYSIFVEDIGKLYLGSVVRITGELEGRSVWDRSIKWGGTFEVLKEHPVVEGTFNEVTELREDTVVMVTGTVAEVSSDGTVATLTNGYSNVVVVTGTVTEIVSEWDRYNTTVIISDGTSSMRIYKLTSEVAVGDVITVSGLLQKYNGVNEITGGTLVSVENYISVTEALATPSGVDISVKGTVSAIVEAWNESYGDMTVKISDGTSTMTCYRLTTKVELGDEIIVSGATSLYQSAIQIQDGSAIFAEESSNTLTVEEALARPVYVTTLYASELPIRVDVNAIIQVTGEMAYRENGDIYVCNIYDANIIKDTYVEVTTQEAQSLSNYTKVKLSGYVHSVLHSYDDYGFTNFYLSDDSGALVYIYQADIDLKVNDLVEVIGYIYKNNEQMQISDIVSITNINDYVAIELTIEEVLTQEADILVQFEGTVKEVNSSLRYFIAYDGDYEILVDYWYEDITVGSEVIVKGFTTINGSTVEIKTNNATVTIVNSPTYETTITEALGMSHYTKVKFIGTVYSIQTEWLDETGTMTVVVKDGTASIVLYNITQEVVIGTKLEVVGLIKELTNTNAIYDGATITVLEEGNGYYLSSVSEALLVDEIGTYVYVKGTVSEIITEYNDVTWDDTYGTMTIMLSDGTNEIMCYRINFKVELNDIVTIGGNIGSDENINLIQNGTRFVLVEDYITVTQALESNTGDYVAVYGTISSITYTNSEYATFVITDGTSTMTIYQATGYISNLSVNSYVVVEGSISVYNGTNQIASGKITKVSEPSPLTVTEALALTDGANVMVKGTVIEITTNWSTINNRMTVVISDGTSSITCYRLYTQVSLGDTIVVNGTITVYNNLNEIAEGATATIL